MVKVLIKSPCSASLIIQYGIKNWPIWEREPCNFSWIYREKEICYIIEGEAKIENGYYTQEPSNEDSTATINQGLKLRNLHDITSRFEFIQNFRFRFIIESK